MAFDLWFKTGNKKAYVIIKYNDKIYQIPYLMIKGIGKINLDNCESFII